MSEVVGLIKCPICGQDEQEVRVNKSGHLYTYCSAGCRITYPNPVTRKGKPALKSGKIFIYNGYEMKPLTHDNSINQLAFIQAQIMEEKENEPGRNTPLGRYNGQPTSTAGNTGAGEPKPAGIAGWLFGNDDE